MTSVCPDHSYSTRDSHRKPENYDTCVKCRQIWDGYLRRGKWKRKERKVARMAGGVRNPGSGAITPENPGDVARSPLLERFVLTEVRQRKTWDVPGWIRECEAEARGQPWLLVISKPDERREYAVLIYSDLLSILREHGNGDNRRVVNAIRDIERLAGQARKLVGGE